MTQHYYVRFPSTDWFACSLQDYMDLDVRMQVEPENVEGIKIAYLWRVN